MFSILVQKVILNLRNLLRFPLKLIFREKGLHEHTVTKLSLNN